MRIYSCFCYSSTIASSEYIKVALHHYYGKDANVVFSYEGDKPVLNDGFISVAHSGNIILIALSAKPVGVDIEFIKQRNFQRIAEFIGKKCNNLQNFYFEWTAYEACFKLGKVNEDIKHFNIFPNTVMAIAGEGEIEFYPMEQIEIIIKSNANSAEAKFVANK